MRMKHSCLAILLMLLLLPHAAFSEGGEEGSVFRITDEGGQTITYYAGIPDAGGEPPAGA